MDIRRVEDRVPASQLIGHGIYSVREASKLIGIPAVSIRRWVFGYSSKRSDEQEGNRYPGILEPRYAAEEEPALSLQELLEVRFIWAFRRHGVSLQTIRLAAAYGRDLLETHYPFTRQRFRTDGRSIFAEVARVVNDAEELDRLIDLVKRQYVFREIVAESLYRGIEYGEDGDAERWYPMPRDRHVVLDPKRMFGKPILAEYSVSTETVAAAVRVEKNLRRVARLYEIPLASVKSAVRFENRKAPRENLH